MSRRPGHEACGACPTCGLTDCPDCDSEGRFCRCWEPPAWHDEVYAAWKASPIADRRTARWVMSRATLARYMGHDLPPDRPPPFLMGKPIRLDDDEPGLRVERVERVELAD